MRIIKKSKVAFADKRVKDNFNSLSDNQEIKNWIKRAMSDIEDNAFCGIPISKKLIPEFYKKRYGVQNLWKYDLPDGWRLVYTITTPNRVEIISIILEWFNHPDYERKFNY